MHESLGEIRRIIAELVAKRDQRRDGFVSVIRKAMHERLGTDADEAIAELLKHGIGRSVAKKAIEIAKEQGALTIFALVDALTRMAGKVQNAGDRVELDRDAGRLLALAA